MQPCCRADGMKGPCVSAVSTSLAFDKSLTALRREMTSATTTHISMHPYLNWAFSPTIQCLCESRSNACDGVSITGASK